jgi:hypothetical protein
VYVFLDIDGVLCPKGGVSPAGADARWDRGWTRSFDPVCRSLLETEILACPGARLVISSNWRKRLSLDALQRMFSEAAAPRVIGVTPELGAFTRHHRYNEVLLYLKQRGEPGAPWVAVEDDEAHFPPGSPLVITETTVGFDEHAARALRDALGTGELRRSA